MTRVMLTQIGSGVEGDPYRAVLPIYNKLQELGASQPAPYEIPAKYVGSDGKIHITLIKADHAGSAWWKQVKNSTHWNEFWSANEGVIDVDE